MDPSGCHSELVEKTETNNDIDKSEIAENLLCEAKINIVVPLTTKKMKICHMKMARCGLIATSDLFLLDMHTKN